MKVVITGPESTGKSTLSSSLAHHYKIDFVREFAREYLSKKDGIYQESDLVKIADGQIALENRIEIDEQGLVICDTSLEVIRIWSEWKYGRCDPYIIEHSKLRSPNLFLLLKPDLPWQPDPLRENPDDRDKLFSHYQKRLKEYNTKVVEIGGSSRDRLNSAISAIEIERQSGS